jgi:hypothetical protein
MTYFVFAGPWVKIGFTCNIEKRVSTIQTYCPYKIVHVIVTDEILEVAARRRAESLTFSESEWFKQNPALIEWINSLTASRWACEERTKLNREIIAIRSKYRRFEIRKQATSLQGRCS